MTTVLMHVSGRLQWACNYNEIWFLCLAFSFLFVLSWVSWQSLLLYVCFGSGCCESLFSLYVDSWCSTASLSVRDPCLFLQFWSDRLVFVTPSDLLSCDEENRDCIMTKHDLSSQPLSTSLNVTQYLLWKLQLKAIWPFLFPF